MGFGRTEEDSGGEMVLMTEIHVEENSYQNAPQIVIIYKSRSSNRARTVCKYITAIP